MRKTHRKHPARRPGSQPDGADGTVLGHGNLPEKPIAEKPAGAPGGIAGRASDREREDKVVQSSDDSFPASDPPAY
jgi:hypothetical protein